VNVISLASLDSLLVAGLVDQGVQLTTDLVNWQAAPNLAASSLLGLVLSPQFERDTIAYLFGPQEGVWRTSDGGQTWAAMNESLPSSDIAALVLSPDFSENQTVVAASPEGLLISQDSGNHWERAAKAHAGLVSFSPNGRLLTAYFPEGGVGTTEDLGQTWTHIRGPWDGAGKVVALSVSNAHHYYVAWLEGIGETVSLWQGKRGEFEKVLSQPIGKNPVISFFVPPEPAPDRPWYTSFENHVWKFSGRKGRSPVQMTVFSKDKLAESILSLTGTDGILLASTGRRVFKSLDEKSWTLVHDFGNERAVSLSLSPTF
jgi:hypothetical protein